MIRYSLNQNTCKKLSFDKFIPLSKDFNGIEFDFEFLKDLRDVGYSLKQLLENLETYDLQVTGIFHLKNFNLCSDGTFKRKIIPTLENMLKFSYELESNLIFLKPSSLEEFDNPQKIPMWRIIRRTKKNLKEISSIAEDYDVQLGLEFQYTRFSSIRTLPQAKKILQPLKYLENVGYIIDLFEFAKSQEKFSQLSDISSLIYLVQLCDLNFTSNQNHRLPLGMGEYPIRKFVNFLKKIGFRKTYSLELKNYDCSNTLTKLFKNLRNYF